MVIGIILCETDSEKTDSEKTDNRLLQNETTLLILGIVQNVEKTFKTTFKSLESTLNRFPNSEAFVYEDNSSDKTFDVLSSVEHPRFHVISERFTSDKTVSRMERIANARNRLLERVASVLSRYKYVVWIDMDGGTWSTDGIVDSLNVSTEWDIVGFDLPSIHTVRNFKAKTGGNA